MNLTYFPTLFFQILNKDPMAHDWGKLWGEVRDHYTPTVQGAARHVGVAVNAVQAFRNPDDFVLGILGKTGSYMQNKQLRKLFDSLKRVSGGSGSAIIPGSQMAYKKRGYSKARKPAYRKKKGAKRPAYKKRNPSYKKKANPTLSLILKGLKNMR